MDEDVVPDNSITMPLYTSNIECINYQNFFNFGWEILYTSYRTNVLKILNIHNDISRLYLLINLDLSSNTLTDAIQRISDNKVPQFPEAVELTNNVKGILPDADPIYMDLVGEIYMKNNRGLSEFIDLITTKKKTYPKIEEYNNHVKVLDIINSLTTDFKIQEFLRMCPDPINYFKSVKLNSNSLHTEESLSYLSQKFNYIALTTIRSKLHDNKYNLTDTVEALKHDSKLKLLKNKRKSFAHLYYKNTEKIEFLKEIAYIDHKDEILDHINNEKTLRKIKVEEAKSVGSLSICECCYNDELLTTEVYSCPTGHHFCSSCIKKGIEVACGENKIDFKCFADCNEEFNMNMIKKIVDEKLFQRIMRQKQAQEIKEADIEGLETCAFCDYSVILSPDLKIINCLNPECKKETCRECREESHFPYKCDEVEKSSEVQVRTMIENKMTEVVIRTCYYCNSKFMKEDGCNKMTCRCGKKMCYICRKPVNDSYQHFYHLTVIENKCPLYTDENILHSVAVEVAAKYITHELKMKQPELLRKIDIEKILPTIRKSKNLTQIQHTSALDINNLLATIIGQNVEDIHNLKDIRSLEPQMKKTRH